MEKLARSRTGVYSGVMTADYQEIAGGDLYRLGDHAATGTNKAILSNRISWFFDLTGPSLTLDTACSSGLYGLHLACQAIKAGECDQVLNHAGNKADMEANVWCRRWLRGQISSCTLIWSHSIHQCG